MQEFHFSSFLVSFIFSVKVLLPSLFFSSFHAIDMYTIRISSISFLYIISAMFLTVARDGYNRRLDEIFSSFLYVSKIPRRTNFLYLDFFF